MKIVLQKNIELSEDLVNKIKTIGFSIDVYNDKEVDADIFIGYPKEPFKALDDIKGLKFIQSLMVGYDHLDLETIKEKGVTFSNASGVSSIPIAEYVVLKMLDYAKDAQNFRDSQKESIWRKLGNDQRNIMELYNKTALILGTGSIGKEIAKRLKAFGVHVIGVNSAGKPVDHFDETYALDNIKGQLSRANFVVGALPLNKYTQNLYDKQFFLDMRQDAVFINVGRGKQVVEADLLEMIDSHLDHVYLDVVYTEPLAADSKLWTHDKISITPHVSASSDYLNKRIGDLILENLENFKAGKKIKNKVV